MNTPEFQPTRVTLLERLRTGKDQTAWLEFESTYRAFIFSLILRMGIPNADAEDISQTVLTKVWQKIENIFVLFFSLPLAYKYHYLFSIKIARS